MKDSRERGGRQGERERMKEVDSFRGMTSRVVF